MKYLKTAPSDTGFFEIYARLSKPIRLSGAASQIVSGLTEVGGIYAVSYAAMEPVLPQFAMIISAIVAIIGTIVIEGGLRQLMPKSVDAILYKRFSGLHLPMTIAILLFTAVLLVSSGYLSFSNSKIIVKQVTPPAQQATTTAIDSLLSNKQVSLSKAFSADTAKLNEQFAQQLAAAIAVSASEEAAIKRELSNWYNKEKRTGQSFATRKDEVRQKLATAKANAASKQADLQSQHMAAVQAAKAQYDKDIDLAEAKHLEEEQSIKSNNLAAIADRDSTVANYGGGLGWFTIVCLFIFTASIILDRIHCKGSGIQEKVELSQYDLNPAIMAEALAAFKERINYLMYQRIVAFSKNTPAAPLPSLGAGLYDPAKIAQLGVTLEIQKQENDGNQVLTIEPKRRLIGFNRQEENTNDSRVHAHESSCAIKDTRETPELRSLKQRLKMYKKRLGGFEQKVLAQKRNGGKVNPRTLKAIDNNRAWVTHYEQKIQEEEAKIEENAT